MTLKPLYDDIYTDIDYGPIATARGFMVSLAMCQQGIKDKDVLCVGSGNAYEAVNLKKNGANVTTLDFVAPAVGYLKGHQVIGECQRIPFEDEYFDYVLCAECLEHIHPDDIDECLSELFRVGKKYEFTIADKPDPYKHDSHICIESIDWWIKKMEDTGYHVTNAQIKPIITLLMRLQDGSYGARVWKYGSGYYFQCKRY